MAMGASSLGQAASRPAWRIGSARPQGWQSVWKRHRSFGRWVHAELQRLCPMGAERPTGGQWRAG